MFGSVFFFLFFLLYLVWPSAYLHLVGSLMQIITWKPHSLCPIASFSLCNIKAVTSDIYQGFNRFLFLQDKVIQCECFTLALVLFINLYLVGDVSSCCTSDLFTSGILRRRSTYGHFGSWHLMAVLKGWKSARLCQKVDGWKLKELALTQGSLSIKDERDRMKLW